ncbi:MAG: orotate phosphoribosyltransferase, partial [Bacilli bacterium]|nr:orotate phosphoribosyltransferase [Bacilli bacterium]
MKEVAKALLEIKAVFLSPDKPFTWASGIKSPIYCDNRLILSYPKIRRMIEKEFASLVKKEFPNCELLMGTATAGIPHAAYISEILDLPMGYVRSSSKDHGRNNQIEGKYEKGQKIVVIEDLISTGKSSIEVVNTLIEAGVIVLGIVSIFTYELEKAKNNFESINIKTVSLTNYSELVEVAVKEKYITSDSMEKLVKWRKDP